MIELSSYSEQMFGYQDKYIHVYPLICVCVCLSFSIFQFAVVWLTNQKVSCKFDPFYNNCFELAYQENRSRERQLEENLTLVQVQPNEFLFCSCRSRFSLTFHDYKILVKKTADKNQYNFQFRAVFFTLELIFLKCMDDKNREFYFFALVT